MSVSINGTNGLVFNDASTQNTAATGFGFKNRIINGAMGISQRGTSFTNVGNSGSAPIYTLDRWFGWRGAWTANMDISQQSGWGSFQNSLRMQRTNASSSTAVMVLAQIVESNNCYDLAGQTVSLSVGLRAGSNYSGGQVSLSVVYSTASNQTSSGLANGTWTGSGGSGTSVSITTTGTTYTTSVLVPSNALSIGIQINWTPTGTAGANDYIEITGVQLEKGSTATSFDYRPYGTELALCQRYYQTTFAPGTAPAKGITANDWWTVCSSGPFGNNLYGSERFKVDMRASPSLYFYNSISSGAADNTVYGYWASSNGTLGVSMDSIATHGFGGAFTGTGIITHGFVRSHYTASAEL